MHAAETRVPERDTRLRVIVRQPLRLLHVFPSFNVGGAQVRFAALANALGDRYAHTVVSLSGSFDAAGLLDRSANVELRRDLAEPAGRLPARLKRYGEIVREVKPDLLATYNWGAVEPALANLTSATPHLHFEDGFGPDEAERQFARRVWTRRVALARSQVVVPSLSLKTLTAKVWRLDQRRVHYIPNGIAPRDAFRTSIDSLGLGLPAGAPRIVWTGALRREKNPIRLLRAFAEVKEHAVLVIVGDGPERGAVEAEAGRLGLRGRVGFAGHRTDARDLIMQCDILALSSDTEQMPLAVLEAMDAGLAVASTDVGDVRHMVSAENRPFVTPKTDAELARALRGLVASAPLRESVGAANRRRMREHFNLADMTQAYAALFDRMAASSR